MVIVTEFGCSVQAYVEGFHQQVFPRPDACPQCHTLDVLIGHEFYQRKALEPTQTYAVRVKRWYCNACHGTTSLLPSFLFSFRHYLVVTLQRVVVARYDGESSWAKVARDCAPHGAPDARTIRRWCDAFAEHASTWLAAVQRTLAEHDAASPLLDPLGQTATFDPLDRLTQVVSGTNTLAFNYNGDGVRVNKTVNGTTTSYVQDMAAPLPVVLVERTGGQDTFYVYGLDLVAQVQPGGSRRYYHNDTLGSTRALGNDAGQCTDTYSYDVFGSVRSRRGVTVQPFAYIGEQADNETQLIFLRARYYDSTLGRFSQADYFPGFSHDSQSINAFAYTQNNPANYADHNGQFVIAVLAAGAIGYTGYEVATAWNDFKGNFEQLETNLTGYYTFDFENPEWNAKYRNYNPERDIAITARSGGYLALKVPGTSVTGPPPTSLGWTEPTNFVLRRLLLPDFEKPAPNRIQSIELNRSRRSTLWNTPSGIWSSPPSQGK